MVSTNDVLKLERSILENEVSAKADSMVVTIEVSKSVRIMVFAGNFSNIDRMVLLFSVLLFPAVFQAERSRVPVKDGQS